MIFEKKRTLFRLLRGFSITFQSRDLEKFKQKFWTIILGFSSWEHDEFYCSDRRFTILVRASCNSNGLTPPCRQGSCGLWFSHSFSRDFKSRTPNLRNTRNISVKKRVSFFFCFKLLLIKDTWTLIHQSFTVLPDMINVGPKKLSFDVF